MEASFPAVESGEVLNPVEQGKAGNAGGWRIAAVSGGLLLVAGFLVYWTVNLFRQPGETSVAVNPPEEIPVEIAVAGEPEQAPLSENAPLEFGPEQQRLCEEAVKRFLEAKTVEEALGVVFHPEVTGERLRQAFPEGTFVSGGKRQMGSIEMPDPLVPIVRCRVETEDYETRSLTLHLTPEGPKVNWEAWTAWSEMPWSDFMREKRRKPTLFRVMVSPQQYYNFGFSDELSWKSYQVQFGEGDQVVSGYVRRGSEVDFRLSRDMGQGRARMTVLLKYPENPESDRQVLIEEVLWNGWEEPTPPK
ncbi:MAG: hypothetical protein QM627_05370 [Luteolibacter sp.]